MERFEEYKKVGVEYIQVIFTLQELIDAVRQDSSILLLTGHEDVLVIIFLSLLWMKLLKKILTI